MTGPEKHAWTLGLLAVNLTALPPLPETTAPGKASAASAAELTDVVLPGPRDYPQFRCGEAGLIPALSGGRAARDLAGAASLPADLQSLVQARAGIGTEQIADRRFDLWAQPVKGAIVLLPHGLKPAADETVCRIPSASASVNYVLRVVHVATPKRPGMISEPSLHDRGIGGRDFGTARSEVAFPRDDPAKWSCRRMAEQRDPRERRPCV